MSNRCECGCDREISQLKDELRSLRYELDSVKRDLERDIRHVEDRVAAVRSDLDDVAAR
jgi:predicted RNase H-like nuclease (RuvC/YqgF family)